MKDVELTRWNKFIYIMGWISFICSGFIIWLLVYLVYLGEKDKPRTKNKLLRSYQKFIFVLGYIGFSIIVIGFLVVLAAVVSVL